MPKKDDNLERSVLYRLLKVLYYSILTISLALIFYIGYYDRIPKKIPDKINSYVECASGKKYSIENSDISIWNPPTPQITQKEHMSFLSLCWYGNPDILVQIPLGSTTNYSLKIKHKIQGSYTDLTIFLVTFSTGVFLSLQIIWEALIYIIFGKKHKWNKLKRTIS